MADGISRNRAVPRMQQSSTKKSGRKTPRRPVTPGKAKAKTGKDLWMGALKKRQALTLANTYRAASPRHKTTTEYFVDTLRKTGVGLSAETNKSQSMTGLKSNNVHPYMSTSHFMRQVMGTERMPRSGDDPTLRANAGTPAYKTPEEYYDEVLALRKQIAALNQDSATSKTKIRRLEEDNQKKEREIEGLLNPGKNGELRRTLGDRQADSGAVVHSLKQKILKLEMQLKDKEAAFNKLQSDLKTTKVDEMRVQLEAVYAEVLRLQLSRDTGVDKSSRGGSENTAKVKALNETVIRLSRSNEQLQSENKALKDDLHRAMEDSDAKLDVRKEYADMNRRELLLTISRLDKKLERSDGESYLSYEGTGKSQGKIELQGSVEDRLHQLDARETELLDEVERLKTVLKRNRDEKRKADDSSSLPPTPRRRQSQAVVDGGPGSRPASGRRSSRPASSGSRDGRIENFTQKHAATSIQRQWRQRKQKQTDDQVEAFRENRAARRIQHGWMDYKHRHYDEELEDATFTIQSAMKGYHARRERLRNLNPEDYESSVSSETDDGVYLIQSSLRGHRNRQNQLRNWRQQYTDDDEDSVLSGSFGRRRTSPNQRPSSAQRQTYGSRPSSASRPMSGGRPSTGQGQRPSSAQRPPSASSRTFQARYNVRSPSLHDGDDDDDDIMF